MTAPDSLADFSFSPFTHAGVTRTAAPKPPHSVVTPHLIDRDGEPTKEAPRRVLALFTERLE
jgi:hypothetical protein